MNLIITYLDWILLGIGDCAALWLMWVKGWLSYYVRQIDKEIRGQL
ncbi:hypothetical protein YPSE1_27570 [Yersinia pseudotuberculosis]|nr:hypothetical protein YPSE1_27570 [Yersinia pseudotuberculosis]CFV22166.1 Uncharacterised protein [Yersinia pseudotuberculosis]